MRTTKSGNRNEQRKGKREKRRETEGKEGKEETARERRAQQRESVCEKEGDKAVAQNRNYGTDVQATVIPGET